MPADWPLARADAQATGVARSDLPEELAVLWKFSTKEGGFEAAPVISGNRIFMGSLDGNLYALDLASGHELWHFHTELGFSAAAAVANDLVYAGDADGRFYCVEAHSGKQKWTFEAGGEIDSGANFYRDLILFGSQDATLYALNASSGKLAWKHAIGDQIRCSPTIVGDRAFLAGCDSKLHVIELEHGKQLLSTPLDAPTGSTPAVLDKNVLFGTEGASFFCIQWTDGKVVWTYKGERNLPIRSSAAVDADVAVVGSRDKQVLAFHPQTGKKLWSFRTRGRVDASPVLAGQRVFVGSADGRLYALDRKSGNKLWEYEAGGQFLAGAAVAQGKLIIGNHDGTLYCFGAKEK